MSAERQRLCERNEKKSTELDSLENVSRVACTSREKNKGIVQGRRPGELDKDLTALENREKREKTYRTGRPGTLDRALTVPEHTEGIKEKEAPNLTAWET